MMRPKLGLLIPIIALAICSCNAAQTNPKALSELGGETRLFNIAENFFRTNLYEDAIKAYQELLFCYPYDSNADIALLETATIYSNQEKYDPSLMTYQRLIAEHPHSEVVFDFDAIFIPDNADKIALIAPQLAFFDMENVLLLGSNLWHSNKLIKMVRDYVQNAIMVDAYYAEDSKKNVQEFIVVFEELHGQSPGFIEALAYDKAMINFYALRNSKIRSRNDLKEALKNLTDFNGVTGYTSFKQNGDSVKQLLLLQIEDNQFVQLNRN